MLNRRVFLQRAALIGCSAAAHPLLTPMALAAAPGDNRLSRSSTVPAGSFSKAALVGAKTVKGPSPDSVSTRPAAFTAATSVVWSAEFDAFSTMVIEGIISAPPTMVFWAMAGAVRARAAAMAVAPRRVMRVMWYPPGWLRRGFVAPCPQSRSPAG